jgi:hypothetical protein
MGSCIRRFAFVPLLLALGACAYTDAGPVLDGTERGFFYPQCYPFLKVNGAEMTLLMVPNPNKQRAAQFGAFLAKNDLDVTFGDCGPRQLKSNMDSTTVPVELFKLLTEAQKAGALFGAEGQAAAPSGALIQIFEFVFDKNGTFVDLKPLIRPQDLIRIPPPAQADARPPSNPAGTTPGGGGKLESPLKNGKGG